jgi:hypothetical protein
MYSAHEGCFKKSQAALRGLWLGYWVASFTEEILPTPLTNLPGQWLQFQANGSNVCQVLRGLRVGVYGDEPNSSFPIPQAPARGLEQLRGVGGEQHLNGIQLD